MSRYVGLGLVAVMLLVSGCVVDPLSYGGGYPAYGGGYPSYGGYGGSGYPYAYNNQVPYYGGTAYPYSNPYYYYGNTQYPTNPSNSGSVVYNHRQQVRNWVQNRRGVVQNPTETPGSGGTGQQVRTWMQNRRGVTTPTVTPGTPVAQTPRTQIARQIITRQQSGASTNQVIQRQVQRHSVPQGMFAR